ncbi:MAG: FtsX-like permease family protein [Lachnospiraceae bacterium]
MKKSKRGRILKLALDVMTRRMGLFILTVFLGIVSFSLVYAVFMMHVDYSISDRVLDDATNYRQKQSYVVKLTIFYDELQNVNHFLNELSDVEHITVGRIYASEINGTTKEIYCVDSGYSSYLKLTSGGNDLDLNKKEGQDYPAYVGSKYEDKYPVGTRFSVGEEIYCVKGILDDGQLFVPSPDGNQLYDSIPSEQVMVGCISQEVSLSKFYLFSENSEDELKETMKGIAADYEYGFRMQSIYQCIQENNAQDIQASKTVIVLGYILLAITFAVICVMAISSVFLNAPMYAVIYAFGYDHKDINRILMLENGVRVLLSVIPAYAISCLYTFVTYGDGYWDFVRNTVIKTHAIYGGMLLAGLGIAVFCVSTLLPVLTFQRMSVTELLKSKE